MISGPAWRIVASRGFHVGFVDGHHPSCQAGTQRVQTELLSVSNLDSCAQNSRLF